MKRWLFILALLSARATLASDAGTTGADFLKLGVGPRAIGMGEANIALADDAYATWWNPAGMAQLDTPEAAATYNSYLESVSQQYVTGVLPEGRLGVLGASANVLEYGAIPGADAVGQQNGSVGASDMALGVSYARTLIENKRKQSHLSFGVTGKYIRERLDSVAASAFAMDAGLHWQAGKSLGEDLEGVRAGLVVRNIGSSIKFDQDAFALPRSVAAGLGWTGIWLGETLNVDVDGEKPQAGSSFFSGGLEVWTLRTFVMRAGYTGRGDLGNGLRVGAGLRFQTLEVDYAFANEGDLGTAHRFGVSFRFGRKPPEPLAIAESWYEKGMKEFRRARYTDALVNFNKALELDPNHPEALQMMKRTYERIKATGQPEVPVHE